MKILMVYTNRAILWESGAKTRINKLVDLLSHQNEVIFLSPHPRGKEKSALVGGNVYHFHEHFFLGRSLAYFSDFNIGLIMSIRKVCREQKVDLICVSYPWGIVSASLACPHIPIVYDSHDVASDSVKITFRNYPVVLRQMLTAYLSVVEKLTCKRASHIISTTELDRERLADIYAIDRDKIMVFPLWLDLSQAKNEIKRTSDKTVVVFHGTYNHIPNREAFNLIFDYIAPEVAKHNSDIQFVVAGVALPAFEKGNVRSIGFVADVSELLNNADIAIVPVRQGTGIRIKIFDYMSHGLPIITTKKGIEGIGAKDGDDAVILDDVDNKFVDAILILANDRARQERLGSNARALAAREYSWEVIYPKLAKMLESVAAAKTQK